MFVDTSSVVFVGGHGGPGIISFGKSAHSGPDGGNGGKGGNIYLRATSDITLLRQFNEEKYFKAQDGFTGHKFRQTGKNGEDLEILVPRGTSVFDESTQDLLIELNEIGDRKLLCIGGKGGRGNYEFRSAKNVAPEISQPGLAGEKKNIKLVLKLIADFGLVGLPNAGKSSLINELTSAKAKVGSYPFTTLSPNLGTINGKTLADIPGLIEGASDNKGLGVSFLKHIEKVGVILHCISSETIDGLKDYEIVRKELGKYTQELLAKKEVILVTKSDLVDEKTVKKLIKTLSTKAKKVLPISIHDWDSLEKLKKTLI